MVKVKAGLLTVEAFTPFGDVIRTYEEDRPEIVKGELREKQFTLSSDDWRVAHFAYHTDAGQSSYPSRHYPTVFIVGPVGETLRPKLPAGKEIYQSIRGDQGMF